MLKSYAIKAAKLTLEKFNVKIVRTVNEAIVETHFKDPSEALLFVQGGKPSSFDCPVELCAHYNGLGFSSSDWNPFVETLRQYKANTFLNYEDSALFDFYTQWTPITANHIIAGFKNTPEKFSSLPVFYLFLSPWSSLSPTDVEQDTLWWNNKDNEEHGCTKLQYPRDGWAFSGPVHADKGKLEFSRTISLYNSLKKHGYDRAKGSIGVTQLIRGDEVRYLVGGGGYHRAAAMAALDYEVFPARFHRNSAVDSKDVDLWPQVRSCIWSSSQALKYIDYLFDNSSKSWADEMGLTKNTP